MKYVSTAVLVMLTASGCASRNITPKVPSPPPAQKTQEAEVTVIFRTIGTHQTLFVAMSREPMTLVSMSLLGTNGGLDSVEVEQRAPTRRWRRILNTAHENIGILTLIFKDANDEVRTARLGPNR